MHPAWGAVKQTTSPGESVRVVEVGAERFADECRPVRCTAGVVSAPGDAAHLDTFAPSTSSPGVQLATCTDGLARVKKRSSRGVSALWCCSGLSFE